MAIRLRIIQSNKCVLDAFCFCKSTEFFRSELCTVVSHELLWNAISRKIKGSFFIVASPAMLDIVSTSNYFE